MTLQLRLNREWQRKLLELGYIKTRSSLGGVSDFVKVFNLGRPFPRFHMVVTLQQPENLVLNLHVDWFQSNHDGSKYPSDHKPSVAYGNTYRTELKRIVKVFNS